MSRRFEDCCELSRFIEEHFDRDVEDFELEVGSAGIGQPFKVLQQYINSIGYDVELLTADGKKMEGSLKSADEQGFVVTVLEKSLKDFIERLLDPLRYLDEDTDEYLDGRTPRPFSTAILMSWPTPFWSRTWNGSTLRIFLSRYTGKKLAMSSRE